MYMIFMRRNYSSLTLDVTKQLSKTEKKQYGFFVTPPSIIDAVIARVKQENTTINTILEPSCGTGEFITACTTAFPDAHIEGVEWNPTVFQKTSEVFPGIHHADFTKWSKTGYDLIIGNPPYFVCSKDDVPVAYRKYMVGRPNMFGIFILHALSLLVPNGVLAFVIPKSFMNSAFYANIREHILRTCRILDIIVFDQADFIDTEQETFGIFLQKGGSTLESPFVIRMGDSVIFTENAERLRSLLEGSTTLKSLGYSVKTGSVVWNQHKDKMTDDKTKPLLIYNSNVGADHTFVLKTFSNPEKKPYINLPNGQTDPVIVVNRGNGNTAYSLTYAFIDGRQPYFVENHLNVIHKPTGADYPRILRSLQDPRTTEFLKLFIGNGGLSKTELENFLPIY
jgi:adenine-specific DNA-methyltransferase